MSEVNETSCGSVGTMGFQAPIGLKKRKKELDEVLVKNPDITHGHMSVFLAGLDEARAAIVEKALDESRFDVVADMCREACVRGVVKKKIQELVRKKGSVYVLYAPHKDKGGKSRPVQEFPSRAAAKRAELSRFPPKDPAKLKALRKTVKKMAEKPTERSEDKPAPKKESRDRLAIALTLKTAARNRFLGSQIAEARASSEWDSFVDNLSNRIVSSDPGLKRAQRALHRAGTPQDRRVVISKRDRYLDRLEARIDSFVASLSPVAVNLLKRLLVQKYRSALS